MTIYFTNRTHHIIILSIDDGEPIILHPLENMSATRRDSEVIKVLIKCNYESKKKSSMYHLVIETEYLISGVSDNEIFNITREKIQFSLNVFYDRLFLSSPNISIHSETHKVLAEDKMKKIFNKSFLIRLLLTEPLETLTGGFVIMLVAGIVLTYLLGWKFAIVYFPVAYLLLITVNWLIDKFWRVIGKKVFKMEDEKKEFYSYFESDFINKYYSDVNRTPFMGKAEIN